MPRPTDILWPKFIYRRSTYAALLVIALVAAAFACMISSSEIEFDDLNRDGDIGWNEVFVKGVWPGRKQWWKYALGVGLGAWAISVVYAVRRHDRALARQHAVEVADVPPNAVPLAGDAGVQRVPGL